MKPEFIRLLSNKLQNSLRHVKLYTTTVDSSSTVTEKIVIPPRIERSPTDILRALAATIKPDPTAAHYKYHDDPYLIPKSNLGKRTFAMAQEAGRKAAVWIRQEHPNLFQQTLSDPPIKAFLPQMVFNEQSEVSEEILKEVISNVQVTDSVTVYNLLESKNITVSNETKQSLLELLCFYNSVDPLSEEFIEERWFTADVKGKERQRKTWNDSSLAEKLFHAIDPPNSSSYATIIQGMCKYCEVNKAWKYYEEAQLKNIPLTTEVYNSLICVANFMREANELRWKFIEDLLKKMQQENIPPNLKTLNSVLYSISNLNGWRQAKINVLSILAEFKHIGIEPSLASWYYVLITLCKERGPKCGILHNILNYLDNQELTIRDPKDTHFFVTAMDVCRNHLQDIQLASRVDQLLQIGNNYDLIGDSYKESVYYRHYFALMCKMESLDLVMEFYNRLVPNIYTPEPGVMIELLRSIELSDAIDLMPRIWSDMIVFDHTDRENLLSTVLSILAKTQNPEHISNNQEQYLKIVWDIYTKIMDQPEAKTNKMNFSGETIGNILLMCLRLNDFKKATTVMKVMEESNKQNQNLIVGIPEVEPIQMYVQRCIEEKEPTLAINAVQYCVDCGIPDAGLLARQVMQGFTLDEPYINRLINIVGKDVLHVGDEKVDV